MTKNLMIKLAITLIVASLSYSVFWFFKTGQIEKRIAKFVNDNNIYVSSGEIKVSGFPFSQHVHIKDLKFRIPNKALDKNQIIIGEIKAKSRIFSNDFQVTISETMIEDENGNLLKISFTKPPEISILMEGSQTITFDYKDQGYEILDVNQKHFYSAQSTAVKITSKSQEEGKISIKINSDIKQINGFDIVDFYRNVFEKIIIKGIQTEKIKLGSVPIDPIENPTIELSNSVLASNQQPQLNIKENIKKPEAHANVKTLSFDAAQGSEEKTPTDSKPANTNNLEKTKADTKPVSTEKSAEEAKANLNENIQAEIDQNLPQELIKEENLANEAIKKTVISDFTLDAEYVLTPTNLTEKNEEAEFDPTKVYDLPLQYSKSLKINSAIFSNENYKITVSGDLNSVQDDSMPFGNVSIQVEKLDMLVKSFKDYLIQVLESKGYKVEPTATEQLANTIEENTSVAKAEVEAVAKTEIVTATIKENPKVAPVVVEEVIVAKEQIISEPYDNFLKNIYDNIEPVANEIALNNPNSNLLLAEFNLKREKNLEFLINDYSMREILGKF